MTRHFLRRARLAQAWIGETGGDFTAQVGRSRAMRRRRDEKSPKAREHAAWLADLELRMGAQ